MAELCDLTAVELRRLIGIKQVSPGELLASCRARIEQVNPPINAFVATCWERAETEAQAAERAVMDGEPLGLLHGLPIGVKDLVLTEGLRTTWGSPLFADFVPEADERQVTAVRAAGAIVVGKTNTPEFGAGANTVNPVYGATGNPFDPDKTCAGSSGGSAVALATGMVPLATGSDTGGSLRNPAAYCGIVGFRPSPGAVPSELRLLGWSPLPVQGPMGRNVADSRCCSMRWARSMCAIPCHPPHPADRRMLEPVDLCSLRVAISEDSASHRSITASAARSAPHGPPAGVFAAAEDRDPPLDGADEVFDVTRAANFLAGPCRQLPQPARHAGPQHRRQRRAGPGHEPRGCRAHKPDAHRALPALPRLHGPLRRADLPGDVGAAVPAQANSIRPTSTATRCAPTSTGWRPPTA